MIYQQTQCTAKAKNVSEKNNTFIHENLYESMINCVKWLISEGYFNKKYLKQ
jgi:hypothetical protein